MRWTWLSMVIKLQGRRLVCPQALWQVSPEQDEGDPYLFADLVVISRHRFISRTSNVLLHVHTTSYTLLQFTQSRRLEVRVFHTRPAPSVRRPAYTTRSIGQVAPLQCVDDDSDSTVVLLQLPRILTIYMLRYSLNTAGPTPLSL